MSEASEFLKEHEGITSSRFEENAKNRRENRTWLKWSRMVALALIRYMEEEGINRQALAMKLNVSPQYVSRLMSGKTIVYIPDHIQLNLRKL